MRDGRATVLALALMRVATMLLSVFMLKSAFGFPDVLRSAPEVILERFAANEVLVRVSYFIYMASSLLTVPLSWALAKRLQATRSQGLLGPLVHIGGLAALVQCIGLVRWQTVVPYLAHRHATQPSADVLTIFDVVHRLAGMGIGEHLGYLAIGTWTILLGVLVARHADFPRWAGIAGIIAGALLMLSAFEPILGAAAPWLDGLNFRANTIWSVWMLILAALNYRSSRT